MLEKYNETKHTATLVSPDLAAEERPALTDALRERFQQRRGTVVPRPKLVPGDKVKIRQKPSGYGNYKRNFSKYSREVFTVAGSEERAGQTLYKLVGIPEPFLISDLMKLPGEVGVAPPELVDEQRARFGRRVWRSELLNRDEERPVGVLHRVAPRWGSGVVQPSA